MMSHGRVKKRAPEWMVSAIALGLVVLAVMVAAGIAYLFHGPVVELLTAWWPVLLVVALAILILS